MKIATIIASLSLILCGCAITPLPTPQEIALKDCGPAPKDYQQRVESFIGNRLKDPESARYKFFTLQKGCVRSAPIEGGKLYFGWLLNVQVNAKNGYGGYTGYQLYTVLFQEGNIVAWSEPPQYPYSIWIIGALAKAEDKTHNVPKVPVK